jgi:hypothetical protein
VELELDPDQPPEVVRAVGEVLRLEPESVDPWWQAGQAEALGSTAPDDRPSTIRP